MHGHVNRWALLLYGHMPRRSPPPSACLRAKTRTVPRKKAAFAVKRSPRGDAGARGLIWAACAACQIHLLTTECRRNERGQTIPSAALLPSPTCDDATVARRHRASASRPRRGAASSFHSDPPPPLPSAGRRLWGPGARARTPSVRHAGAQRLPPTRATPTLPARLLPTPVLHHSPSIPTFRECLIPF